MQALYNLLWSCQTDFGTDFSCGQIGSNQGHPLMDCPCQEELQVLKMLTVKPEQPQVLHAFA